MIEVAGLSVKPGLLQEISFELEEGKILGLLGPNGSGKSTLLKSMAGFLKTKTTGHFRVRGQETLTLPQNEISRKIQYVGSEQPLQFQVPVEVLLDLFEGLGQVSKDASRRALIVQKLFLQEILGQDFRKLSGGEKQRVQLACALLSGARTLLLDEAFSKMDLNYQNAMEKLLLDLKKDSYTFILVTHDLDFAERVCDEVLWLRNNRKMFQGPTQVGLSPEMIERVYQRLGD